MGRTATPVDESGHPCPLKSMFSRKAGRPPNAMAGDVEERIIEAARAVFLQHGFGGASLDRIAEAAGASKATLYSRFSGKEALFSEMIRRNCEQNLQIVFKRTRADTLPDQLIAVTQSIVTRLVSDDVLGLIRMVIAEAPRFPALAKLTSEAGRSRSINALAAVLVEHRQGAAAVEAQTMPGSPAHRLATRIMDAIVAPMVMRALMFENLDTVRAQIPAHVAEAINLFVSAGALDAYS